MAQRDPFAALVEQAPLMTLLLNEERHVVAANLLARTFFEIEQDRLPASLVEVTLEASLLDVLDSTVTEAEAYLVHHRRTVLVTLAPSLRAGEVLMFLSDVTELRRLATVRQEFVANLVHELKTPITSLRLTAESLLGDPSPKDRHRFAERLVKEADLLSKIIDNLRQLGDIEARTMAVETSPFDLGELVQESVTRLGLDRPVNRALEPGFRALLQGRSGAPARGGRLWAGPCHHQAPGAGSRRPDLDGDGSRRGPGVHDRPPDQLLTGP